MMTPYQIMQCRRATFSAYRKPLHSERLSVSKNCWRGSAQGFPLGEAGLKRIHTWMRFKTDEGSNPAT